MIKEVLYRRIKMRERRLLKEAICKFELDLKGLIVLTEAATGNFVWTPIIAALAKGEVIAYSRTSKFGTFREIKDRTEKIAKSLNIIKNIKIVDELTPAQIRSADIITNTGFLRPLNKRKLQHAKQAAVVSLMYETWEYRETDLDLRYCFKHHIPVLGTNESHPDLCTIDYMGMVSKKLLLEMNVEILKSKIGIIGSSKFCDIIFKSLISDRAICRKIVNFSDSEIDFISNADALIVSNYGSDQLYFSDESLINAKKLKMLNPDIIVLHICGKIDRRSLLANNIKLYPMRVAPNNHMTVTTGYVGPKSVIDLHTAGLKVGERLARFRLSGLNTEETVSAALKNRLCQNFTTEQLNTYKRG